MNKSIIAMVKSGTTMVMIRAWLNLRRIPGKKSTARSISSDIRDAFLRETNLFYQNSEQKTSAHNKQNEPPLWHRYGA
jgi:hypothetical protein